VAKTIKESLWEPTERLLKQLGLWSNMRVNKTEKTILDPVSGNAIIMTGLDDPEKIKSIFGITKIFVEEITELDESDYLQLILRMRGSEYAGVFQLIGCFNPVSDHHFLVRHVEPQMLPTEKKPTNLTEIEYLNSGRTCWRFGNFDADGGRSFTTVLNTNYKHNTKLDIAYISKLKLLAGVDEVYHQVYEQGRWGVVTDGNRYSHKFKESVHVKPTEHLQNNPIHYSIDFNVSPHMTGICIQLTYEEHRYKVRVFKAFALKFPENEAYHLGTNFVANFQDVLHFGVYLYGDASGNNRTGIHDTKTYFHDVLKGFDIFAHGVEMRVPSSNPRYDKIAKGAMGRKTFLNAVLSGALAVDVQIDPACTELISDLRQCTQDANGKLAKPKNKEGHEERGHALQAFEYFICHDKSIGKLALL
jgi:hypothetical protein